ncbi:hypothetical protein IQ07DRAFT_638729 [Pyrenochaeta sp. DS3sAY3a]|nr:hypothetical protein IQ07DRAFT_638729 [Pyrenochaeta sp. DS3sAY3a]
MSTSTVGLGDYVTRINVPASRVLFPIPPPSPSPFVSNPDSTPEPFPDFNDTSGYEAWEEVEFASHCSIHCKQAACGKMVHQLKIRTTCRCDDETPAKVPDLPPRPQLHLRDSVMNKLLAMKRLCRPDTELEIHDAEVYQLLRFVKTHTLSQALENKDLLAKFEQKFPGQGCVILEDIIDIFFEDAVLYFKRTVPERENHVLTVRQLRQFLQALIFLSLEDWVASNCGQDIYERAMSIPPYLVGDVVKGELAGTVLKFWDECLNNVIAILVWRQKVVEGKTFRKEEREKEAQMKKQCKEQLVSKAVGGLVSKALLLCFAIMKFFV